VITVLVFLLVFVARGFRVDFPVSNGWCRKKRRLVAEEGESSSWVVIEGYHTTNGGINNTYRSDPQRHFSKCFSSSTQYYSDLQQKRSAATSKQLFLTLKP